MLFVLFADVFAALSLIWPCSASRGGLLAGTSALGFSVCFAEATLLFLLALTFLLRLTLLAALLTTLSLLPALLSLLALLAPLALLFALLTLLAVPALFLLACSFCW